MDSYQCAGPHHPEWGESRALPGIGVSVCELVRVTAVGPRRGEGILTLFPFDSLWIGSTLDLRIDLPVTKRCLHGTLLHVSLQSSRLNTCYFHQDLH
eukprot:654458-Amorphochlora_amoeboformis.AAC.2